MLVNTTIQKDVVIFASIKEAELLESALRALNEKYEKEKIMTPQVKDEIITGIMLIEGAIMEV